MMLAYKYRVYPTESQKKEIHEHFDIHASIYNKTIDTLDDSDWVSEYDMHKKLTQWKKDDDNNFGCVNSKAAQETVGRVYRAINGLSAQKENGRNVGKLRHRNSFTSIEYNQIGFDVNEETVRVHPFGEIDVNKHRRVSGEVKGITIKETSSNEWYISVITNVKSKDTIPIEDIDDPNVVGIDFNISNLFTDSDGRMFESLWDYLQPKLDRVDREHQKLSRKKYGSNNWEKQKVKLSKAYDDLTNARDDILHKLSRWYVDNFDGIALENVGSEDLSRGPVKYVKEQAWRKFQEYVQYKASHAGVETFEVSPEYTTQDCSNCENRVEKELSDKTHDCEECGLTIDRDLNAARNIVQRAISSTVGQGLPELTPFETDSAGEIIHISLRTVVDEGSPSIHGARFSGE